MNSAEVPPLAATYTGKLAAVTGAGGGSAKFGATKTNSRDVADDLGSAAGFCLLYPQPVSKRRMALALARFPWRGVSDYSPDAASSILATARPHQSRCGTYTRGGYLS